MMLRLRDDIANTIVRAIAEPFGVIFGFDAGLVDVSLPSACSARHNSPVRSVQEFVPPGSVSSAAPCARAGGDGKSRRFRLTACLSHICSDAHRFGFARNETPFALKRQAAELARRAIDLDPASARAYHAMGLANWFLHDVPASVTAMQTAVALNHKSAEIVADLGLLWSLRGEWGGPSRCWKRRGLSTPRSGTWRSGLSLYHFADGRFEHALADAVEIDAPDVAHGFVIWAISQVRLGRKSEAREIDRADHGSSAAPRQRRACRARRKECATGSGHERLGGIA